MRALLIVLLPGTLAGQMPSTVPVETAPTAFVGVSVVPMDTERVLANQTVVVQGGVVRAIGPVATTRIPEGARRIEASGKFLMPGLVDMHAHVGAYTPEGAARLGAVLPLFLANGITTVRSMVGNPTHIALRTAVASGSVTSPRLVLAAPQITGPNATGPFVQYRVMTPAEARERVRQARDSGFDFIKVTFGFTQETYSAVADAAREFGLPLSGHVTPGIPFAMVLAGRQQIEHLDGYLEAIVADASPVKTMGSQANPGGAILRNVDRAKLQRVVAETRAAGIANTPTLSLFQVAFIREIPTDSLVTRPGVAYFQQQTLDGMRESRAQFWSSFAAPADDRRIYDQLRNEITKALSDGGALILAGSDSPQHFQMVGFALHSELRALVAAGLTPFQALSAATRNPAQYFGASDSIGTVAVSKRADLVLLDANPLRSVLAAETPAGVMIAGRWFSRDSLRVLSANAIPSRSP